MVNLSRLEEIKDLRTVWPHEALDFTPWLSQDDNISLLADAIGLDIAVDETESSVGDFNVDISKTLDISVNCNDYNEKDLFSFLCERVRDYSDGEVWSDGDQILCKTESAANALCDLLWQLYNAQGETTFDLHTGYYDPKEDERNHEEDRYTGWWYVSTD